MGTTIFDSIFYSVGLNSILELFMSKCIFMELVDLLFILLDYFLRNIIFFREHLRGLQKNVFYVLS